MIGRLRRGAARHADAAGRLRWRRDLASAAQIGIAGLAVLLGGGMSALTFVTLVVVGGWAMLRQIPDRPSTASQRLWTLGVFAALVATIARALLRAEFLDAGVDFLLLLVVQRLFHRQRTREHMQLLLLGALLMVVGAVINAELSYPFLLAAYLVATVLALILNNLVAEGERMGPRVALELSREGLARSRNLWSAALAVAALAAAGAIVTFVVFPRWGVGAFLRGAIASETRSGFSNEVELGGFGTIKEDATVVMRIEPLYPAAVPDEATWHLRGSAFDIYEDGRWRTGRLGETGELLPMWQYSVLAPGGRPVLRRAASDSPVPFVPPPHLGTLERGALLHARVTLEDIGADVLFVASEPLALKLLPRGPVESRARVVAGRNREFRIGKLPGPVRYEFISRTGEPSHRLLEAIGDPPVEGVYQSYLQHAESLSPEVTALARGITKDATSRLQKAQAVMEHLGRFDYTLQQRSTERAANGADPVEGFLFESQAGHCEYFATAMAVLLREVGVPTRIVNGYYGAHKNELGGFYTVRQADAHSWVEVHFGALGWVTFDPTPPDGRRAGADAPFWPAASELVDALRNRYLEWVVGFDLSKQLTMLDNLGVRRRGHHRWRIAWGPVLGWTVGVLGVVLLGVRLVRMRRAKPVPAATKSWTSVVDDLRPRGYSPAPAESPTAFAARLHRDLAPAADEVTALARDYESVRFGPPAPDQSAQHDAVAQVAALARRARLAIRSADW